MPAEPFDPVAHPQQADTVRLFQVMLQRNADPVIPDGQLKYAAAQGQRHLHMQCPGVAMNIQQCFLRDPQKRQCDLTGVGDGVGDRAEIDPEPGPAGKPAGQRPERRAEPLLSDLGGVMGEGKCANLPVDLPDRVLDFVEQGVLSGRTITLSQPCNFQPEGKEQLTGGIVQFPPKLQSLTLLRPQAAFEELISLGGFQGNAGAKEEIAVIGRGDGAALRLAISAARMPLRRGLPAIAR